MSNAAVLEPLIQRPEPKRDRYGRYLIAGQPYTRVTTIAETVEDRYNLELWQQRMVALGLTQRRDLWAKLAATPTDDKQKLNAVCKEAIEAAKGSAGANIGSALHAFTELVDMGRTDVTIPEPWDADVAAYQAAMAAAAIVIEPEWVERIVVCRSIGAAGTFDRLVRLPGRDLPVVADLKTGGFLSWQAIAIQLACYANAEELYDPVTDTTSPMPPVDRSTALVMHLPEGKAACTLHLVDIEAGWSMARVCTTVRQWRKRKDLASTFDPDAVLAQRRLFLLRRVERIRDSHADGLTMLAAVWPAGVATFKAAETHTPAELDLIAKALSDIEGRLQLQLLPADPADGLLEFELDTIIGRLKALPVDLLARVEIVAKDAEVPHLKSGRVTAVHLDVLRPAIDEAEAAHTERRMQINGLLATAVDVTDAEMVHAIATHLQIAELDRCTAEQVERLGELCRDLAAGGLQPVASENGWLFERPSAA